MSQDSANQLLRSAPYFPVADVEQSATHYEGVFGFRREYVGGAPGGLAGPCALGPHAARITMPHLT